MYDRAETRDANNRFWDAIAARLPDAPSRLTRDTNPWDHWRSGQLLFSQTCGLPFRMELHEKLSLIGTPDHAIEGCLAGYYCSVIVANAKDPRSFPTEFQGASFAYNSVDSQSGYAAIMDFSQQNTLNLVPGLITGAHLASARAVADGVAEIAALDAVTWSMIAQWDDFTRDLKVIGQTSPTPALPFVTDQHDRLSELRAALKGAVEAISDGDRKTLRLFGIVDVPAADYLAIPLPPPIS